MSVTLDANVLIYATNESEPVHHEARQLLERRAAGPDLVYLFWPVVLGYLRIVTHSAILPRPLTPKDAMANVEVLLARPHVRSAGEAQGFWKLFRATAGDQARGNDVPDAHLATLMRQHGVRLIYTRDRGFRRFPDIEAVDPFDDDRKSAAEGDTAEKPSASLVSFALRDVTFHGASVRRANASPSGTGLGESGRSTMWGTGRLSCACCQRTGAAMARSPSSRLPSVWSPSLRRSSASTSRGSGRSDRG